MDGGEEIGDGEGDGTAEVDVAGVSEKADPGVGSVLDRRRRFSHCLWIFKLVAIRLRVLSLLTRSALSYLYCEFVIYNYLDYRFFSR